MLSLSRILPALLVSAGLAVTLIPCAPTLAEDRPPEVKRRALLVGISQYDRGGKDHESTDWWNLSSDKDVDALAQLLSGPKFNFEVKVLKAPAETTHKAIVETFRSWLIAGTSPGDTVFFHYSGHGSQAPDTDTRDNPIVGDEISGLDQTLVPSDYVSMEDPSRDIRDDEVGILLEELHAKRPGQVFLSFDTCHSGSITRGAGRFIARGKQWTGPKPVPTFGTKYAKTQGGFLRKDQAHEHNYVVLEASRDDQLAHQLPNGTQMGLLTFALIRALNDVRPNTTYRDVFYKVRTLVSAYPTDQDPQIEGDDLDNVFLTNIQTVPARYVPLTINNRGELTLAAGTLQGVTEGSSYAIFANGEPGVSRSARTLRAVTGSPQTTATILVSQQGLDTRRFSAGKAVEVSHKYGDNRLRFDSHLIASLPYGTKVRSILESMQLLDLSDVPTGEWDVRACTKPCPSLGQDLLETKNQGAADNVQVIKPLDEVVSLQRADGSILGEFSMTDQLSNNLAIALERESRWRFVNSLTNSSPHMSIDIKLVPIDVETKEPCGAVVSVLRDKPYDTHIGQTNFAICDYVAVEIKNSGGEDAFVSVIDLQNNGTIGPLWPQPQRNVADNHIPNDSAWHRLPLPYVFRITAPLGKEVFKAIATTAPTDFSLLMDPQCPRAIPRPRESNAAATPLGQLLRSIARGTRSAVSSIDPSDWTAASVVFDVVQQ